MVVNEKKFSVAMFFLRVSVLLVMAMWTFDKLIDPGHAAKVLQGFYALPGVGSSVIMALGAAELVLLVLFFFGILKTYTYGAILLLHALSTFSAFGKYMAPFDGNLLFFAAWPMLAACVMLFLFRDQDTLFQFKSKVASTQQEASLQEAS